MRGTPYAYQLRGVIMGFQRIRAANRGAVDWVAKKFYAPESWRADLH